MTLEVDNGYQLVKGREHVSPYGDKIQVLKINVERWLYYHCFFGMIFRDLVEL